MHLVGDTVVQTAFVIHNMAYHPRGRRAAYNQCQVVLKRCPTVPEIAQRSDEARTLCVHRGQFVEKHNTALLQPHFRLQERFQHAERR